MTTPRNLLTLGALALSVFTGFAADAPKKAEAKKPEAKKAAKPTGKYMDMDYGRFLSASIDNALGKNPFENKGCAANKAVLVNLGKEDAGYAFDKICFTLKVRDAHLLTEGCPCRHEFAERHRLWLNAKPLPSERFFKKE